MSSIARRALLAGGALLAALGLTATAAAADDWGQQVADLEQAAAAVDRAGAPTVVYLRAKHAGDDATRQDARNLLNLEPGDSRHGSAALVAGTGHADRLDDARLQGIYDGTMRPYLARADLAGALTAALGTVVEDLGGGSGGDSDQPTWSGPGPDTTGSSFTGDGGASSGSSSGGGSF